MAHKSFTFEEFLQLAIAMTDRLGSLHAAHLVHNKIMPANMVWNPKTQQLEIIDFGMANRVTQRKNSPEKPAKIIGISLIWVSSAKLVMKSNHQKMLQVMYPKNREIFGLNLGALKLKN